LFYFGEQLRGILAVAEERKEIRAQRIVHRGEPEAMHERGITRHDAAVGTHDDVAGEILIDEASIARLAATQRFLGFLLPGDVGIDLKAGRGSRVALQRPMAYHVNPGAVATNLDELAFPEWLRPQGRFDVSIRIRELRLQELIDVLADRFFLGPAVDPL
jgi:hypothetical protein